MRLCASHPRLFLSRFSMDSITSTVMVAATPPRGRRRSVWVRARFPVAGGAAEGDVPRGEGAYGRHRAGSPGGGARAGARGGPTGRTATAPVRPGPPHHTAPQTPLNALTPHVRVFCPRCVPLIRRAQPPFVPRSQRAAPALTLREHVDVLPSRSSQGRGGGPAIPLLTG